MKNGTMSFLKNFRNNVVLSTAPSSHSNNNNNSLNNNQNTSKTKSRSVISERRDSSQFVEDNNRYNTYNSRRNSGSSTNNNNNNTLKKRTSRDRNQPPIIVYVDKNENKKPGILRTNTFTKNDDLKPVTRSNTFTIHETDDEKYIKPKNNTNTDTFTKRKDSKMDVFEPLYAKQRTNSVEKLPHIIDTRTYRKKANKTSKPVHKVESFIKNIFGSHDKRKTTRESPDNSFGPFYRDIGIQCKLDDEEKTKVANTMRRRSQVVSSRESLLDSNKVKRTQSHRQSKERLIDRDQSRDREYTLEDYDRMRARERSKSPQKAHNKYRTLEKKKEQELGYSTIDKKKKEQELGYSTIDKKKKEQELGYSTIDKKKSITSSYGTMGRERSQETPPLKSVLTNGKSPKSFSNNSPVNHIVEYDENAPPKQLFRSDTYNTLKEEYEHTKKKPVGIASPRLSSDRLRSSVESFTKSTTIKATSKHDIPKYTFGGHLENRRSRFQDFQKSFKSKEDDVESDISYTQSFFVPI